MAVSVSRGWVIAIGGGLVAASITVFGLFGLFHWWAQDFERDSLDAARSCLRDVGGGDLAAVDACAIDRMDPATQVGIRARRP